MYFCSFTNLLILQFYVIQFIMKTLITIPHYYKPNSEGHGSYGKNPEHRIRALTNCLFNLHSLFGNSQCVLNIKDKIALPANLQHQNQLDIIICTANQQHILEHLNLPEHFYTHLNTELENPKMLGFECHKALKENLGQYDYYCFMEDDLIINDSQFFKKLIWFNSKAEYINLLQPNRYETSLRGKVLKCYVDGDINPRATENYQNVNEFSHLNANYLAQKIGFQRPLNPHSGCFFLTSQQMEYWASQPYFLDMDTSFISPLESSASLGITKTFRVYKPTVQNADFFEIQHFGDSFLSLIGNQVKL